MTTAVVRMTTWLMTSRMNHNSDTDMGKNCCNCGRSAMLENCMTGKMSRRCRINGKPVNRRMCCEEWAEPGTTPGCDARRPVFAISTRGILYQKKR